MNDELAEQELRARSKALFDDAVEHTDAPTRARLRAARERALEALAPSRRFGGARLWVPAAGAAALIALVSLPLGRQQAPAPVAGFETVMPSDLEILLADEELEMLADLEFYEWLDQQDAGNAGSEDVDGVG